MKCSPSLKKGGIFFFKSKYSCCMGSCFSTHFSNLYRVNFNFIFWYIVYTCFNFWDSQPTVHSVCFPSQPVQMTHLNFVAPIIQNFDTSCFYCQGFRLLLSLSKQHPRLDCIHFSAYGQVKRLGETFHTYAPSIMVTFLGGPYRLNRSLQRTIIWSCFQVGPTGLIVPCRGVVK